MNVEELFALNAWIDREIGEKRVVKRYQALHNILNQNAQPNQAKQPFEQQKSELINILRDIDLPRLTIDQLNFLENLGIAQHVGEHGISEIEDILVRNPIDVATAASRIAEIVKRLSQGVEKSNQIKAGLSGCVELTPTEVGEILVRVSFSGNASMTNIVDFKKWGADWHDIGRGIAMVHGVAPEDIRIVGAKKGSIVIELVVVYVVAMTVSTIILQALKVAERVLDIKKKAEEIRGMRLSNDKIEHELDQEAETEKAKGIERITAEVVKKLGKKAGQEGDQIKALETSVKKLIGFVEKGGEVDCVVPEEKKPEGEETADDKERARQLNELRASFASIRVLEAKLKQIEYKK